MHNSAARLAGWTLGALLLSGCGGGDADDTAASAEPSSDASSSMNKDYVCTLTGTLANCDPPEQAPAPPTSPAQSQATSAVPEDPRVEMGAGTARFTDTEGRQLQISVVLYEPENVTTSRFGNIDLACGGALGNRGNAVQTADLSLEGSVVPNFPWPSTRGIQILATPADGPGPTVAGLAGQGYECNSSVNASSGSWSDTYAILMSDEFTPAHPEGTDRGASFGFTIQSLVVPTAECTVTRGNIVAQVIPFLGNQQFCRFAAPAGTTG